jgi:hypothetical protein
VLGRRGQHPVTHAGDHDRRWGLGRRRHASRSKRSTGEHERPVPVEQDLRGRQRGLSCSGPS